MPKRIACPNCKGHLKRGSLALDERAWECENCHTIFTDKYPVEEKKGKFNPSKR